MLLQLIVSQYKNGDKQIKRFLDSVNIQQNIDFSEIEVLIVNDGDELILSEDFQKTFDQYEFNIKYVIKEWGGISSVRQYGTDIATAKYIMYCDGDDLFLRTNSLWEYFTYIYEDEYDIITAKFSTDLPDNSKTGWHFRDYNLENVWIHGKAFKLEFLRSNNIRWCNDLQIYEDSFFVRLCFIHNPKKINIENATYFWKFTGGSWTRTDENWTTNTYCEKVKSNEALVNELLNRGLLSDAANYIWAQLFEMYFTISLEIDQRQKFPEAYEKIDDKFIYYFERYLDYMIQNLTQDAARAMMEVMYRRFFIEVPRSIEAPVVNGEIDFLELSNKVLKEIIDKYNRLKLIRA